MAAAFQSVGSVAPAANLTSVVIPKPTGLAATDLMVAFVSARDNGSAFGIDTLAGWTALATATVDEGGGSTARCAAFRKTADSGDAAASDFTFAISGGTADQAGGLIYRVSGQHPTTPIDNSAAEGVQNSATPSFATTITPATPDELLLMGGLSVSGGATGKTFSSQAIVTSNPSWTEDVDASGSTSLSIFGAHASRPEVTATGNSSFTSSGDATTDSVNVVVAVKNSTNITVTPSVIQGPPTATVQAPSVAGGTSLSVSVITSAASVQTPTRTGQAAWSNQGKNTTSWSNQSKS